MKKICRYPPTPDLCVCNFFTWPPCVILTILKIIFLFSAPKDVARTYRSKFNYDCPNNDIKYHKISSIKECRNYCDTNDNCVAFVTDNKYSHCWIKKSCTRTKKKSMRRIFIKCKYYSPFSTLVKRNSWSYSNSRGATSRQQRSTRLSDLLDYSSPRRNY